MKTTRSALMLALVCGSLTLPAWGQGVAYDPYEGYNRFMFGINDSIDRNVLIPVARGYRAVTPKPVRSGVGNFFNNLRDLVSVGHNLLRLDIEKASIDLVRVGINTTFGLGGLIDIAGAAEMPNHKTTLGDTFASWGWKNSNYFVYPLLGPSTVRDSVATTAAFFYPVDGLVFTSSSARWGAAGLKAVDTRANLLDLTDGADQAAIDRYAYMRDAFMAARAHQVGGELPSNDDYVPSFEEDGGSPAAPATEQPAAPTDSETNEPAAKLDPPMTDTPATPSAAVPLTATEAPAARTDTAAPAADIAIRDLPPYTISVSTLRSE